MTSSDLGLDLSRYKLGWADEEDYVFKPKKGLNTDIVQEMSWMKGEPDWMRDYRLKSLQHFERRPMPNWGGDMSQIYFDDIYYYIKPTEKQVDAWDELPESVKNTYEKLGIPEAERKYLAGVTAQYESEVVYHRNREDLEKQGVIFTDMDTALREYPELVKQYFGKVIPKNDNKFAALNSAVWSGGCLTDSARINVRGKGLVSIANVEEGDEVFGTDLERHLLRGKVLAKVASGLKPVYRMRVAGRELEATGNHQFLVARRSPKGRWTAVWSPLDEIEVGEPIAIARELPDDGEPMELPRPQAYVRNHHHQRLNFPTDTSADLMWILGLWLGDGHTAHIGDHMRQISFSLPVADPVHDQAQEALWRVFGVDHVTSVACGFVVSSKELGNWLTHLGFEGLAKTKRIPSWVYSLPQYQQLDLLAGLVDADGWTERDGASMCLELSNRELLEDVRQLAISCGLFADGVLLQRTRTQSFRDGREVTATSWRLRLQGDLARVPTRDPRKAGKPASKGRGSRYSAATGLNFSALSTDTVGFAVLQEKVPVGERETYDIQVVGLENFVANGIVAHNSFIYVPPGVNVEMPLQAYFRINAENMGQFERTLIIADEGAQVHYIEGCSAPVYTTDSLHSAVVEIVVKPSARVTYTTIQNWSNNVFNLVTKRARVEAEGHMEWIDGNIGSRLTMKYPAVVMVGPKASGEVLSVAYAGPGQHQDAGAKMTHAAPETTSKIVSKSISKDGGRTSYRGLVRVEDDAYGCKSHVQCDALILDEDSVSDTFPYMEVGARDAVIGHEATVSKVADEQLFYLMSRGLSAEQAMGMIVNGFIEPVTRTLPMEYAVEWSRLIELQMEGSVG
jgi:Fe-S cluster assembly scaffold protein SufB